MSKPVLDPPALTTISVPAVTCGRVNQFIVLGQQADRYTIQWCAIGDPTDWPVPGTDDARSKQAGQQTFPPEFGEITGISGDDFFGYVFQEKAITKMTYVGGDVVFAFDTFEETRGCWEVNRYERADNMVFFESEFGYHMLQDGIVVDIGYGFVDDSYQPIKQTKEQENVCVNEALQLVIFESRNLCYNYKTQQWSRLLGLGGEPKFSINDEDGVVGEVYIFTTLAGLTDNSNGANLRTTLQTTGKDLGVGGRVFVSGVRPRADGGTQLVQVRTSDEIGSGYIASATATPNSRTGLANFREQGRYVSINIENTDGFNVINGADIEFYSQGHI